MLITAQKIVDTAIDLADMRNSQFIDQSDTSGSEILRYLNIAYRDLYNTIIQTNAHYFTTTSTINLVGGTDSYSLPSDFYKLDGVDLLLDSSGKALTLRPFMFADRNKYKSSLVYGNSQFGQVFKYLLVNNTIKFFPTPSGARTVTVWYTPSPAEITSLATTLEVVVGGDEYLSLVVAMAMLSKEESDTTALNNKRLEVLQQLKVVLQTRDSGAPEYITDESSLNAGVLFPFRSFE